MEQNNTHILWADIPGLPEESLAFIQDFRPLRAEGPVRLDAFLLVLCLGGASSVLINSRTYHVAKDDLVLCHPNIMIEAGDIDPAFRFRSLYLARPVLYQLSLTAEGATWDLVRFIEENPVIRLEEDEVRDFCQYYDLLRAKAADTTRRHRKQTLFLLLSAFLNEFRDVLERFVDLRPQAYTAGNNVFRNFLELLGTTYPKPRSVAWYASKLCLTPKYLSTVCKDVSGQTAGDIIDHYVVRDIDTLLRTRGKSIKEVCNELEFPNLSFFGRYVKKHLGASPKMYRAKMMGE